MIKSFLKTLKRVKLFYYIKNGFLDLLPRAIFRKKLSYWLHLKEQYPKELLKNRVDYYCNTDLKKELPSSNFIKIKDFTLKNNKSFYYYDLIKIVRHFNKQLKINYKFGDIDENQQEITIVKSRPIHHNGKSVLLKLNSFRHYRFIDDEISFSEKKNEIVWRGVIHKENRRLLVEKFYTKDKFNVGTFITHKSEPQWIKSYLSIKEQLQYKFILSIEGNDVATNLKWVMSSNSLCFMPKPKFETWYMEGKLVPNFHYVLIKDDYSDIEEKMDFYSKNILEAEKIIQNAKNWTEQFKDPKLEKLIALLVTKRFFEKTNQD